MNSLVISITDTATSQEHETSNSSLDLKPRIRSTETEMKLSGLNVPTNYPWANSFTETTANKDWTTTFFPLMEVVVVESSTSIRTYSATLEAQLHSIYTNGKEETFEDGLESTFSKELKQFIEKHGNAGVESIAFYIQNKSLNPEIISETMRVAGEIQNQNTHRLRRWILVQGLFSELARIRDGALIGLAAMDDYQTIPDIEKAIQTEKIAELCTEMKHVIKQLNKTRLESLS